MNDEIYRKLAEVLDTLPNGFPSTEKGIEIKLLKKVFTQEEGELFCDLRLTFESAEQIAQRTGRPGRFGRKAYHDVGKGPGFRRGFRGSEGLQDASVGFWNL